MKVPISITVAICSSSLGYFIGTGRNRNGKESGNLPSTSFIIYTTAFAKSSVPAKINKNIPTYPLSNVEVNSEANELVKYGFPSMDNLRAYEGFILSYDKRNRCANWVLEHLTPEKLKNKVTDRSNMKFLEDESVHVFHRATNDDYKHSGYDRGHLAAAGNHKDSESMMAQTFLLSNITPQVGDGFNRHAWNDLEKRIRATARCNPHVYVCTGPLYIPRKEADGKNYVKYQVIGRNNVAVPTHFFKVVLIQDKKGDFELLSYVVPNEKQPLDVKTKAWLVPLNTIERAAGLMIFDKMPKNMLKKVNDKNSVNA